MRKKIKLLEYHSNLLTVSVNVNLRICNISSFKEDLSADIARELRREKISHRLKQRLDEGMVNEVKALLDSGISSEDLIYYGLERLCKRRLESIAFSV